MVAHVIGRAGAARTNRCVVDFPFPDAAVRLRIWQRVFPPGVTFPSDDVALIAERFAVTGGSIRNVAVDAAFRAVAESNGDAPTVEIRHVVAALAREYEKLGKLITRGEFSDRFFAWRQPAVLPGGGSCG